MSNTILTNNKSFDAVERAVRTFVTGMISAVIVAILPIVFMLLGTVKPTMMWFTSALVMVGTVAMGAIASYVGRYAHAPAGAIPSTLVVSLPASNLGVVPVTLAPGEAVIKPPAAS